MTKIPQADHKAFYLCSIRKKIFVSKSIVLHWALALEIFDLWARFHCGLPHMDLIVVKFIEPQRIVH